MQTGSHNPVCLDNTMALFIFKYCLPALLGYTLFVGIAGRLNPLKKPKHAEDRPSWALGLWTGVCVSLVLGIGLHMAYGMSLEGARKLIKPSIWLMAALLLPGFISYVVYQRYSRKAAQSDTSEFSTPQPDYLDLTLDTHAVFANMDIPDAYDLPADLEIPDAHNFLANPETVDTHDSLANPETVDTHDSLADPETVDTHESQADPETADTHDSLADPETVDTHESQADPETVDTHDSQADPETVDTHGSESADTQVLVRALKRAELQLADERRRHEETGKHLRITRKGLSVLEAESRDYESRKADSVIKLEEELTQRIEHESALETQARRTQDKLNTAETNITSLKQNLVNAKQDIRRSTAARAKALSTANKSIAFARQSVQIRSQLETEIAEAKETLKNRQSTMSSLIRALEKEKRYTQEEVTAMAKQLALQEKQTKARLSLESVARNVENKLTSRLVKKVAKARPLTSGS